MTRFGKRKRFIHVLRNPYDNIAAMVQHGQSLKAAVAEYSHCWGQSCDHQARRRRRGRGSPASRRSRRRSERRVVAFMRISRRDRGTGLSRGLRVDRVRRPTPAAPHKILWHPEILRMLERRIAAKNPMIERYRFAD